MSKSTADIAKRKLLKLAGTGCNKPKSKDPLYGKLTEYINEGRSSFDPDFTNQIKALAPSWFVNTADLKKQALLELARFGGKRPNQRKHPLGHTLDSYTKESSNSYDPAFVAQLMSVAPHWFRCDHKVLSVPQIKLVK